MTVRKDICLTGDGAIVDPYYVLEYPDWVQTIPIARDGKILITREYRHGVREIIYGLPTGFAEPADNSPMAAAQREMLEETGYSTERMISVGEIWPNPATHNNKVFCFAALDIRQTHSPQDEPSERIECEFVEVNELLEMISKGRFSHGLHVAGVFMALKSLKLGPFASN
jgi:8-oxo-dGTP pyrophosphatase MutT (NUDIX family)